MPSPRYFRFAIAWIWASSTAASAQANGALIVDDAGIVDPDVVQNENWFSQGERVAYIAVTNFSVQPSPRNEFSLQAARVDPGYDDGADFLQPQLKHVWRKGGGDGTLALSWVAGLNAGDSRGTTGAYFYLPATVQIDARTFLHVNLGWLYTEDDHTHAATTGVNLERRVSDSVSLYAETFVRSEARGGLQLGPRFKLNDHFALDAFYGHNITGSAGDWFTLGLNTHF